MLTSQALAQVRFRPPHFQRVPRRRLCLQQPRSGVRMALTSLPWDVPVAAGLDPVAQLPLSLDGQVVLAWQIASEVELHLGFLG